MLCLSIAPNPYGPFDTTNIPIPRAGDPGYWAPATMSLIEMRSRGWSSGAGVLQLAIIRRRHPHRQLSSSSATAAGGITILELAWNPGMAVPAGWSRIPGGRSLSSRLLHRLGHSCCHASRARRQGAEAGEGLGDRSFVAARARAFRENGCDDLHLSLHPVVSNNSCRYFNVESLFGTSRAPSNILVSNHLELRLN